MHRRVAMIVIGSCLAANCLGCGYRPRHGLILRGDWSLECNRTPWLNGQSTTYEENSGCVQGGDTGCATGMKGEPTYPAQRPAAVDAEHVGYTSPISERCCVQCGTSLLANRACRTCGHHGGKAAVEVGYYNHPRFHPVPTRPVFSPRTDESFVDIGQVMPVQSQARPVTPIPAPPEVKLAPPMPVPEEIRAPRPQPSPTADRVTSSPPQQDDSVSRPFSWIFSPSTAPVQSATRVAPQSEPRWIRR